MSDSKSLVAFSGYQAKINNDLSVNFHSSFRSTDKRNYECTYEIVIASSTSSLTINEVYALVDHLQKILSISIQIPHVDNTNANAFG